MGGKGRRVGEQRREELRERNSSAFRSTAVELHILVCRLVSPLVTQNWNRQARPGSCSLRSCRRPGRVQGRSVVRWGCTAQMLNPGTG